MARDKSLITYPTDYIVLDIETTGLSPVKNEIIELSAIRVVNNKITEEFSKLINPECYVSSFITNLTGITTEMLYEAEKAPIVIKEFMDFLSESIVIGHNITFDISFIDAKLKKFYGTSFNNDYIDTLKIARKFLPQLPSKKLGLIAKHFKLDTNGMHRGLKDCMVTNTCYQKFLQMHEQSLLKQINALGLPISN